MNKMIKNIKTSINIDLNKFKNNQDNVIGKVDNINFNELSSVEECNVYDFTIKNCAMDFSSVSDKQNTLLTQLAYLNFDINGVEKYINEHGSITLKELQRFLIDGASPYLGYIGKIGKVSTTGNDLLGELIDNNLGDIKIVKIIDNDSASFNAIVFEDSNGNRGFSFRGTDTTSFNDLISDSLVDFSEYFNGDNQHVELANSFFNKYKNSNGNNYLFGHSLGGNTVYRVFMKNSASIKKGFVINALPLGETNTKYLKSLNVNGKLVSVIIEGDWVSKLKEFDPVDGVKYVVVKSNNAYINDHVIEAAMFNEHGDFIQSNNTVNDEMQNVNVFYKGLQIVRNGVADAKNWGIQKLNDAKNWGSQKLNDVKNWGSKKLNDAKNWGGKKLNDAKNWVSSLFNR